MPRAFFVTGTDTGVGKTTVAAGIVAALRRRGFSALAHKPVETGCAPDPEDGLLLHAASNGALPLDLVVPQRFAMPAAPAVAARREGRVVSLATATAAYERLAAMRADLLLVEGAGGLLVPYTDHVLGADLAAGLALPLLLVARTSLGTINHTLLTLSEAKRRGLRVHGVIFSRLVERRGADEDDSVREIERLGGALVLGTVPFLAPAQRREPAALAEAIEAAFDPAVLLAGD